MKKEKEAPLGAITLEGLNEQEERLIGDPSFKQLSHSLSRGSITNACFDPSSLREVAPVFSIHIETLPVANQKASGRCWIFAALNFLREIVAKKCNIKEFELSQNYLALFDKIEKANFALEALLSLADKEPTDRVYMHLLNCPVSDGGQWDMFVSLVKKYGVMPKSAFPETFQSENTRESDALVNARIRSFAALSHKLVKEGKLDEARKEKEKAIEEIRRLFFACFGIPPKTFDFVYVDSKKKHHIERGFTPVSFYEKFIGEDLDLYQSLINSPTKDKPYNKNYTVDYLGNVIEGKRINHLNLPMNRLKEAIISQVKDGRPVWFGSDVGFYRDRDSFAWNDKAIDYRSAFGFGLDFDKADMLDFRASAMNHAMLIVGVDIESEGPVRWKIENSWGKEVGLAGYYVMSDSWFDKFVYQAVVQRKYLTPEEVNASLAEPIHLDPWDPMGTLAD